MEIVRTEPRDVAPVIPLPVRMHGNRVVRPLDVPAGTVIEADFGRGTGGHGYDAASADPASADPGPLARALMALAAEER